MSSDSPTTPPSTPQDDQEPLQDNFNRGRFLAGTLLADRYRIISLLGRGGMGEVYKAEDLKLGQVVALKVLPDTLAHDGAALARFHREVRVARQITHSNVCRVHDIGEIPTPAGSLHFLSMEYIDGEDLSTLLRRIDRLPADKGVVIARQICAGLSAAHELRVLHRDLKPANIMIDGRGRARITDFGLSGLADEFGTNRDALMGTPAYMAPEQLSGKAGTVQSDIYALGLVLYEIFTGKRVFEGSNVRELIRKHESITPRTPSSLVRGLDPLVERSILRCLEKDPQKRPRSAAEVSADLPGGDPLAAAVAAGETPSPEMVAAAGSKTGLSPALAVICLLVVIAGLVLLPVVNDRRLGRAEIPLENSPEILGSKARDVLAKLGYLEKPVDSAYGFQADTVHINYINQTGDPPARNRRLLLERPATTQFWYRESPQPLRSRFNANPLNSEGGRITASDPPPLVPGMIGARFDLHGRLVSLYAVPRTIEQSAITVPDWPAMLIAAGFDAVALEPAEPQSVPLTVATDAHVAWTAVLADQPEVPLRIEAAAWRGRPVYFEMIGPWTITERPLDENSFVQIIAVGILITAVIGITLLAWRNVRLGRGDRRGAFKVGLAVFVVSLIARILIAGSNAPSVVALLDFLMTAIGSSLFVGTFAGMAYLAFEPHTRRVWPQILITWTRLLDAGLRDSSVGRDLLVGLALAVAFNSGLALFAATSSTVLASLNNVVSTGGTIGVLLARSVIGSFIGLGLFFFFSLFRAILRNQWLASAAVTLLFVMLFGQARGVTQVLFALLLAGAWLVTLRRYGLLTASTMQCFLFVLVGWPFTANPSAWYAGRAALPLFFVLVLAFFAFRTSLAGQHIFRGKLLDE